MLEATGWRIFLLQLQLTAALRGMVSAYSTAHSMGYGKRHTFFRHYLTSAPDV